MSSCVKEPKWLDNAVFYEIYPQSFNDTNADGIGDIPGIIEKLDYIKDLGCTALWLNPCFLSPFGDAGYDVEDYYTVAPRYGTNADLVRLFKEAHERDMHVILDLVPEIARAHHERKPRQRVLYRPLCLDGQHLGNAGKHGLHPRYFRP